MVMATVLTALLAGAVVVCLALAAMLRMRDRELKRIAGELERRDPASDARVTLRVRTPGLLAMARAVNARLDAEQGRRIADARAKAAFQQDLASLSHDIRTPLAGAQGYLQLAAREESVELAGRYIGQAAARLGDMRGLVDGLFEYARAADPDFKLELDPVDVRSALVDVLVSFYPEFSKRGWEPAIDIGDEATFALANDGAVRRVFSNLASNALRYGTDAPCVSLCSDGGDVRVRFANAVSHPEEIDADRLFERFYRHDAARAGEGSGLGLAIVARLVESMGGTVRAFVEGGELAVELSLRRV